MKTIAITAATLATLGTAAAASAQTQFDQVNRVFVDGLFNADSDYGDQPTSIAFDGTTAYLGGLNNGGNVDLAGIGTITDLYGVFGTATTGAFGPSVINPAVGGRGYNSIAYDAGTNSVIAAYDSGAAGSSTLARYDASSGSQIWSVNQPSGARPFVAGADPIAADVTDPSMAAFLVQGSGRRLALDIDDGSLEYSTGSPSPGGAIIFDGDLGTAFRGMDFNTSGDLAYATANGFGYYERTGTNTFSQLSKILTTGGTNNLGRDIAILEGLGENGADLLAVTARGSTAIAGNAINENYVYIIDLDGNIIQELTGDESGLAETFANNTKQLDYAIGANGAPTLAITDLVERRVDIYQIAPATIPEPGSLALLGGLGGLTLLRRRRNG